MKLENVERLFIILVFIIRWIYWLILLFLKKEVVNFNKNVVMILVIKIFIGKLFVSCGIDNIINLWYMVLKVLLIKIKIIRFGIIIIFD